MEMAGFREEVFRRSAASFGVDRRGFECNALVSSIKAEAVSRLAGKEANDCVVQFVECFIAH